MTTVAMGRRDAQPLSSLGGGGGWDELEAMFAPREGKPVQGQPGDETALFLAALAREARGREFVEWLMDITFRQPFRATGRTMEETALLAATRQGIEGVGEVILNALAHGEALLQQREQRSAT
ncbi:hypothetical protein [Aureimonas sp. D3]|uniref:hypothetical protein n=1 Tax=Aureimonas sp. D3 TaxID=1638164 RepID=UPI0007838760|nr:hypothetical protein [Aureimonas sp. D3]